MSTHPIKIAPEVVYEPLAEPIEHAPEYHGTQVVVGHYRVTFPDGWTLLSPHVGWKGTISMWPVDLAINPEFRDGLIEMAERAREVVR